jgi:hypothetical protein
MTDETPFYSEMSIRLKIDNRTDDKTILQNISNVITYLWDPIIKEFPEIRLNSFYRCEKLNKAVGGRSDSKHLLGQAIDIFDYNLPDVVDWIKSNLVYDELIVYSTYIHISFDINKISKSDIKANEISL